MEEDTEAKKAEFEAKHEQHQKEREEAKAARDADKEESDPEEELGYIEKKIKDQIVQIEQTLSRIPDLKGDKTLLEQQFNIMFGLYDQLRDYLASILFCLPKYTQQSFQQQVDELHKTLTEEKEKALPKKRFHFRKQNKIPDKPKETVKQEMKGVLEMLDPEKDLVIRKLRNEIMIVDPAKYEGKQAVYIENIENCEIYLPFIMKALYIKNTYHSRIFAGFVLGASHIETTNKSNYHITSHQCRIHKANEVTFQLDVKSHPIIEDCSKLVFGPNRFTWPTRKEDEEKAEFDEDQGVNKWAEVNDFKWIKSEQSPNWRPMSEEEISVLPEVHLPSETEQ